MASFHIGRDRSHSAWDNSLEPAVRVAPGDEIELTVADASGGQLTPTSTADDVPGIDLSKVNPVTGPIHVEGAEPGDALSVEVLDVVLEEWGWTANIPGFGLLADRFPAPHLRVSKVTTGGSELLPGLVLPLQPMIGTIGLAPRQPGQHPIIPPGPQGGNMDIRHLGPGARAWFPVAVPGALLSAGDTHAAQGDGEVCGTAIETGSTIRLRIDLEKDRPLTSPQLHTRPASARPGEAFVTTGIGPDLFEAARAASLAMIGELAARTGIDEQDAYLVLSCAADLKISEVVDQPNWVVSLHLEQDFLRALG